VGVGALPDISSGLKVAIDLGARVLNLSFGTAESDVDPHGPLPHASVVEYAERNGCVLIAASGNSGRAERYYPAALPQVIAVGSVDSAGARSHFSTYGDHVALCAPGEHIVSSGITGLREGSGTSYAAPFVTGAAALLVARARRRGRDLRSDDVRRLLVDSAAPLPGGRSPETGAGLLDAAAALRRLDAEAAP
jgi:subtilisin family serine protease